MMKRSFLWVAIACCSGAAYGQKPALDSSVYATWPSMGGPQISADGQYICFQQQRGSYHALNGLVTEKTVVRGVNSSWVYALPGSAKDCSFTKDGRLLLFMLPGDSLGMLTPGKESVSYITGATAFQMAKNSHWIAISRPQRAVTFRNLQTGKELLLNNVNNFTFTPDGQQVIVCTAENEQQQLTWLRLSDSRRSRLWEGSECGNVIIDRKGQQIAFTTPDASGPANGKSIWYYREGMPEAEKLITAGSPGITPGLFPAGLMHFSKDGRRIFFRQREPDLPKAGPDAVKLDIWSYTDPRIQPQQLSELAPASYASVVNISDKRIIRLENAYENIYFAPYEPRSDEYEIVNISHGGFSAENHWNKTADCSLALLSTVDGSRIPMGKEWISISPEGRYAIYYDTKAANYFSYEIATGETRNITAGIRTNWTSTRNTRYDAYTLPAAGWIAQDAAVFLHDEFDIWQIDPSGKKPPIELTNGYGKRHKIYFERIEERPEPVPVKQRIILAGFNRVTKDNGFYAVNTGRAADPEILTEGNHFYLAIQGSERLENGGMPPLKAAGSDQYIVQRCGASESPNYFATRDFKTFRQLTELYPERQYNWYTKELHSWTSPEGRKLQGIMHKPENFDPSKRYPVIFYYYEIVSDGLNIPLSTAPSDGRLNVAWYVSNGYLVFMPDIEYTIGEPMKSTYDCVVSAANYVGALPYVNKSKMGIQGISWGGFQTDYLVTHTDMFAAACTASGISDFISHYNNIAHFSASTQAGFERGQFRLGATLWERPDWYVQNSPILKADKVTSPLLMFHTTVDGACPFPQSIELFTALRRLGKRAWLLEYNDGNHGVMGRSAEDFSIRMAQFFDHYLKDKPAPLWMTQGRPAALKGIDERLGLDAPEKTPGAGLDKMPI